MLAKKEQSQAPTFKRYFSISLILHLAILFLVAVRPLFFDTKPKNILPSVQIDLVALPDNVVGKTPKIVDITKPVKEDIKPPPKAPEPVESKNDLTFKKKAETREAKKTASEILKQLKNEVKSAKKRTQAEKRALEEEQKNLADFENKFRQALKGNQKATGNSATGDINDSATVDAYGAHIREALRENWALPANLQSSSYRASVVIFIDSSGKITSYRFTRNSGSSLFDEYVRSAIAQTKFAPPPLKLAKQLRNQGVGVNFPL